MKFAYILPLLFIASHVQADVCQEWLNGLGIKKAEQCESECRIGQKDMSTYMCSLQCEQLCKNFGKPIEPEENFYGLTDAEIKFCKENKLDCLKAYKETWAAEKICLEIYPASLVNDESDACRHYTWALLLSKAIGEKNAETVLNAHETNPKEPNDERAMDLANNRLGLLNYKKLNENLDSTNIKKSFLEELKSKKLIILKPQYSTNGGLP